jgi:hypothetical protein
MDGLGPRVKTWAPVNDRLMFQDAVLVSEAAD